MPITELLERNAREFPKDIALVEINPDIQNLWIKLAGLSGEYQSLVVMRMSVILLRLIYSDLILLILVEA